MERPDPAEGTTSACMNYHRIVVYWNLTISTAIAQDLCSNLGRLINSQNLVGFFLF